MSSGITRQALRRHGRSLAGPACTQLLGAATVGTMITTLGSLERSFPPADRSTAAADLREMAQVFAGDAVYLTLVVVGVTMNVAVKAQLRDIALLRAIGAAPGQVRRSVVLQAALLAVPTSLVGGLLGLPAAALWLGLLRSHHVAPVQVSVAVEPLAVPVALAVVLAASLVGAAVAATRTVRALPAVAMTEATTSRSGAVRLRLGVALFVAAAALSTALSLLAPSQADDAGLFVMLAQCLGVGLLGPGLLKTVCRLLGPLVRGGTGRIALDAMAARSGALSGALVPLVLATAFALVKVVAHTTASRVTGSAGPPSEVWADGSGTAVFCAFASVASLTCFVSVVVQRAPDLAAVQLAGSSRRRVVGILAVEAAVVTGTAVLLSAAVALVTLVPLLHASLSRWLPYVPVPVAAGTVVLCASVVLAGTLVPAALLARRPAVDVVRGVR